MKIFRQKRHSIVTTHDLGKLILETKIVPTPIYTSNRKEKSIKF